MTAPNGYTTIKAIHVAAAMIFAAGVLSNAVLLTAARGAALASTPVAATALAWSRRVTTPAMLLVWAFGLALGIRGAWFSALWLQAKLVVVVALSALHGLQSGALRRWAGGMTPSPRATARSAAWIVASCLVIIAGLAVTKPG